jgi:predicted GIY-YIG superfamily endonuclease
LFEEHGGLAVHLRWNPEHNSETKLDRFMEKCDKSAEYIVYLLEIEYDGSTWYYVGETCRPYERFSRHLCEGTEIRKFPTGDSSDYEVNELILTLSCESKEEADNNERLMMLATARWFQTFQVLGGS